MIVTLYSNVVAKGQSHNLCKAGNKRRRTKAEIKEDERQAFIKDQEQAAAMEELAMLRQKVQLVDQQANENQASSQVL